MYISSQHCGPLCSKKSGRVVGGPTPVCEIHTHLSPMSTNSSLCGLNKHISPSNIFMVIALQGDDGCLANQQRQAPVDREIASPEPNVGITYR